jgi:hypothetical protein
MIIEKIEKLGFDNWFWESIPSGKDKVDLWTSRSYRDVSGNFCHGATVAALEINGQVFFILKGQIIET